MAGFCMVISAICGLLAFASVGFYREPMASLAWAATGILWLLFAITVEARALRKRQRPDPE